MSVLAGGTVVHCVHTLGLAGNAFDPCRGGPSRFAPIQNAQGECVPSLYAATSLQAAVFETLFHDVPLEARRKTIPRSSVEARQHTVLQLRRDLRLASLRAPGLLRWRVASALVWSPPTQYAATALWAKAIHDQFEDVEGLIWTSRRCDPDSAMLFFGGRATEADLQAISARDGADASFLREVREAGEQAGVAITE
ncbi:MAG: RES family NAD+ phosphorylase [Gammaproteobacteria bacterium]|nr:RES family NAD+ phosphorylase [Gammaproteobacteria bacterium]